MWGMGGLEVVSLCVQELQSDAPSGGLPSHSLFLLLSRVLYGNKITDLPRGVFGGLYTLQLL